MAFVTQPIIDRIRDGIEHGRAHTVIAELREHHPADIAEVLDHLRIEEAALVYEALDDELAADVLVELPEDKREAILGTYTGKEIAEEVIDQLDSDDAADVIADLPEAMQEEVMANIEDAGQREEIAELLTYDENTAGGLMAKELVKVNLGGSMLDCVRALREHGEDIDNVYQIHVVDDHGKLMGAIPLKKLITVSLRTPVRDVYDPDTAVVSAHTDAEEVARLMEKYNLAVMPVVDDRQRLVGRITFDDVMDTIRKEETEDVQKMAGMGALEDSYMSSSWLEIVKKRVGWLIIRALALGDVTIREWWSVVKREFSVGLILGSVLGIIGFLRVAVWSQFVAVYGEHWLEVGLSVGISLLGVVLWGNLIGSLFPLILKRLGRDPAVSSAPFVATVVDVTGLVIYFGIASMLLAGTMI